MSTSGRSVRYSVEPPDPRAYTESLDQQYSRFAHGYDLAVKILPCWRRWLRHAIPAIEGPRVLEVSFGTGWLLTQYAGRFLQDTERLVAEGVDLNEALLAVARRNLARAGVPANLRQGNVEALPYPDASFDTVVTTMAFTGYPDGAKAMSELARVLRPGGRLVMIDVGYPHDGNWIGTCLVELWKRAGDLIRDMSVLFAEAGFSVVDEEVGGWGSVHRYVATKHGDTPPPTR